MRDLTIRYALPGDIESICHVHHSAVKAIQRGLYEKKILDAWIAAVTPVLVKERMKLDNSKWFVAGVENKVTGFAAMESEEIKSLYVHPDYQGKGIGSKLLKKLESEAALKNINRIFLNSSLNACKFYEAHGFSIIKKTVFRLNETVGMNCIEMAKDINFHLQSEQ